MSCQNVGESNADIGGIGIQIAFTTLAALSGLLLFLDWLWRHHIVSKYSLYFRDAASQGRSEEATVKKQQIRRLSERRAILTGQLLAKISDVQTFNGLALIVSALSQVNDGIDLYHLRLVYENVALSCISGSLSLCGSYHSQAPRRGFRIYCLSVLFIFLLGYSSYLCKRLSQWDLQSSGQCYNPGLTAAPSSPHPRADIAYVAVTLIFAGASLGLPSLTKNGRSLTQAITSRVSKREGSSRTTAWLSKIAVIDETSAPGEQELKWRQVLASGVAIVHIYMIFALRASNADFLENNDESTWGFGQVVAIFSIGNVVTEIIVAAREYRDFKNELWNSLAANASNAGAGVEPPDPKISATITTAQVTDSSGPGPDALAMA